MADTVRATPYHVAVGNRRDRTMSVQATMEHKLREAIDVVHLEVVNESDQHNVAPGSESHFNVVVVSPDFDGVTLVARHRLVYRLLDDEIRAGVHALALHTYSEADWRRRRAAAPASPSCLGGKARERAGDP